MTNQYFATVARGLEEIAAKELENLGAENVNPDFTGVYFEGDQALLYKVNIWSRIIFRVLVPLNTINSKNTISDTVQNDTCLILDGFLHNFKLVLANCIVNT